MYSAARFSIVSIGQCSKVFKTECSWSGRTSHLKLNSKEVESKEGVETKAVGGREGVGIKRQNKRGIVVRYKRSKEKDNYSTRKILRKKPEFGQELQPRMLQGQWN